MRTRGRPGLPVGSWGQINVAEVAGGKYSARARYRDRDGVVRPVLRYGQTKAEATRNLRDALANRQLEVGEGITSSSTVRVLAADWLADVDASSMAVRTKDTYRQAVDRYVLPEIGALRLSEATTGACDAALKRVAVARGAGAAKTARAVLTGMFKLAVKRGALTVNPIRETSAIARPRALSRSLTQVELEGLTDYLRTDARALTFDLPDLVDFGLGTGCRIGEVMAIRETALDFDAGTVEINATAVRVPKVGMLVQERPKTAAGWRVLALPPATLEMMRRRREEVRIQAPEVQVMNADGAVRREKLWMAFPAPLAGTVRDPSNTSASLREALARYRDTSGVDLTWVSYHVFRKTVATILDAAGFTSREIADQLGHSQPSMTQDRYMGRKVVSSRVADVLGR